MLFKCCMNLCLLKITKNIRSCRFDCLSIYSVLIYNFNVFFLQNPKIISVFLEKSIINFLFKIKFNFSLYNTEKTKKSIIPISIYILIKFWSPWLIEAVRTNPGYGMATIIYNFWDFWELFFFCLCKEARLNFYTSKTVSTILIFWNKILQ